MKKRMISMVLILVLAISMLAGCGGTEASIESAAPASDAEQTAAATEESPAAEEAATAEEASVEVAVEEESGIPDLTESDRNLDFAPRKELIKSLTTQLPITEETVELSYWLDFETSTLTYIDGSDLNNHPIWAGMEELTGVKINITQIDQATCQEKFDLMLASGDYYDLFNGDLFSSGVEYGYEEEIIIDMTDLIPEYAPNYWTLVNSNQDIYQAVHSTSGQLLEFWWLKDEVGTPDDQGSFIRMDWLEDLNMEVPATYDELFDVLSAFKIEKGATEPLMLYNTIAPEGGCLIGGFGANAVYNNTMAGVTDGFYLEDGTVVYGATANGSREFLRYLNKLHENDLIDFDTMLSRDRNPFADITAGYAQTGVTGYFYNNQPFGGVYSQLSADENCNWWPVRDVAKTEDTINTFASEVSLVKGEGFCISTQCDEPEIAIQWIDYWYSYDGYILANYGIEGESFEFDDNGEPQFIPDVVNKYESTNLAMCSMTTQDVSGIFCDLRLDFTYEERENSCFDAWMTNKNSQSTIGSRCQLDTDEANEFSAIYGDIQTYVSTSAMQFVNGDLDVNDDAVWDDFVSTIEGMGIEDATAIIQGAYDRAYGT